MIFVDVQDRIILKAIMQTKQIFDFPVSIGSYASFVDHIISLARKKAYALVKGHFWAS